jgi:CBS domain-containing protein
MLIRDILRTKGSDVVTVGPDMIVQQAMQRLVEYNIGSLVVVDGEVCGIITERDMLRAGAADVQRLTTARVGELMSRRIVTADLDADLQEIMTIMTEHRIRHLPIVVNGSLQGIVSIGDVVNALRQKVESENHCLHAYIDGSAVT